MIPHTFYLTLLLFVREGEEEGFLLYEESVLPLLEKYNGRLLYRVRPERASWIHPAEEHPYEIHIVSFAGREDFERYLQDEDRKQYTHLFRQSVSRVILLEGRDTGG